MITNSKHLTQLLLLAVAAWAATYVRVALGPLQEAVQGSLALSDNQVALMQGMAMAVPIALSSIPLGLLADRASRKRILLFSLVLAVVAFVLSALAANFHVLMAARCLIGLSVPGLIVTVYSMAGDLFAPTERGRATMVVSFGEIGGAPVAFALGGMLLATISAAPGLGVLGWGLEAWRSSLLWMGGVLIPILILILLLLREPPRLKVAVKKPPLREVWTEFWRYRAVAVPLQLARAALFIAEGAVFVWGAPLFARNYHLSPDRIGALMGAVLLVAGVLGPALGGPLTDFCQRRWGPRGTIRALAGIALLSVPAAFFALVPDATLAGVVLAVFLTLGFAIGAAALALTLIVIPSELRGLSMGISVAAGSLFFVGLAPLAVSGLSGAMGGETKIGEALTIVCVIMMLMNAGVLAFSARHFPRNASSMSDVARSTAPVCS